MATRIDVAVFNSRLIQEHPNKVRDAVLFSTIKDEDFNAHLLAASLGSIRNKANRLLKYAEDYYVDGLPTVELYGATASDASLKAAIAAEYGLTDADIDLIHVSSTELMEDESAVHHYLKKDFDWNSTDNVVGSSTTTTLRPREPSDVDGVTTEVVGNTTTVTTVDPDPAVDVEIVVTTTEAYSHFVVDVVNSVTEVYGENGIIGTIPEVRTDHDYYVVRWEDVNVSGIRHTWTYNLSTGSNADLNNSASVEFGGSYLPIMAIRWNKQSYYPVDPGPQVDPYLTTRDALKIMDIGMDTLVDAVDENPDIDVIDDAFVNCSANIYSKEPATIQYLIRYFLALKGANFNNEADVIDVSTSNANSLRFREGDFDMVLHYSYIGEDLVTGVLPGAEKTTDGVPYVDKQYAEREIFADSALIKTITFRWQVTDTEYQVVTVYNPRHVTIVRTSHSNHGLFYQSKSVEKVLQGDIDTDEGIQDSGFLIPISMDIVADMDIIAANSCLYDSMQITIYAVQKTKLKWYETGIFKVIVTIVGFALAIYTGGQSIIAASAISATAVAVVIIKIILVKIVLDYAIEWILENIGGELAVILATLAALTVASITGNFDFGSLTSADNLLKMVTTLGDQMSVYVNHELQQLREEYGMFEEQYQQDLEAIDDIRDEFGLDNKGLPLYLLVGAFVPRFNAEERPDAYYTRTTNLNPGVESLNMLDAYVDSALLLP